MRRNNLLKDILEELDLSVVTADDGEMALDLFSCEPDSFDIVLSDVKMPKMDGLELLHRIRSKNMKMQPIFILLTGGTSFDFDDVIRDIDGYLLKPYEANEIQKLVTELLEKRFRKKAA